MTEQMTLAAEPRTVGVKRGGAKTVRAGLIPGVVYGSAVEPFAISIEPKDLDAVMATEFGANKVFDLAVGDKRHLCMVKDTQFDVVRRHLTHVDLYVVDPEQSIVLDVPVRPEGKSAGERLGGLLQVVSRTVRVRCKVKDIPPVVLHDVTEVGLGDQVSIDQMTAPAQTEFVFKHRFPVIRVAARRGGKKGK
ncbi:MAG: 50S ribosomal protein L25 [Myxococcales bacterium]|nr:50S ribosomal protein L25 [Myxococcales bacterium]MCB9519981.1 50S ribosomal protein L25 [Myxococcales bacterium]MCB9533108.1 50S ribosomal protein L25 [Myxococcales bacterium]